MEVKPVNNLEGFDQKYLSDFNKIIKENIFFQLDIKQLCKKMTYFHNFTPNSLHYMIRLINKNQCTFYGYGPYINPNGYWNAVNVPLDMYSKTSIETKLAEREKYIIELENTILENNRIFSQIGKLKSSAHPIARLIKQHHG